MLDTTIVPDLPLLPVRLLIKFPLSLYAKSVVCALHARPLATRRMISTELVHIIWERMGRMRMRSYRVFWQASPGMTTSG